MFKSFSSFKRILSVLLSVMLLLSASAVASVIPAYAEGKTVTLNALYGKIENYQTASGLRTYFIVGFSSDADTLVKAIDKDRYLFNFTVRDETAGTEQTFEYHSRSSAEVYDTDGWDFARIPVCEYGVYPQPGRAYTLSFTAYDGDALAYSGASAAGAFVSSNEDFLQNGPVIPDLSCVTVDPTSPLRGRTILFVGDSITEAICEVNIPEKAYIAGWPGRVGVANGAYYMNLGYSGATISNKNGSNQVLEQLKREDGRSFDLIIVHGGANDAWFVAPVGEMTGEDVFEEGSFDLSTFAGGLEETFRYLRAHYPDAKYGYIINHTMPASVQGNTADMHDLFALAAQICDKWEIPYLDLYNNEELNVNRMRTATKFTLGDNTNVHPNDRGYDILFPYVNEFCKTVYVGGDVSALGDPPYTPPAEYTVTGESNVALGKSAKTSSGASAPAATDGKVNAYVALGDWADSVRSPAYGTDGTCYLEIDLGGVYDLDKINVVNYVGNLLYKWDAYLTLDNSEPISAWTKAGGKTTNEMSYEDGYTISFSPISARYIRIYGMGHTGIAWVLNEVSAYGSFNEDATLGGVELEMAESVSAKTPDGAATDKLTDGNTVSDPAVTGKIGGGSVTVDLGGVYALSLVHTDTAEDNSAYSLWGSANGSDYTQLGFKALGESKNHDFAVSGSYRYLKIVWENSERADNYVALAEVTVYDAGGGQITGLTATAENAVYGGNNPVDGSLTSYTFINGPKTGFVLDAGRTGKLRKIVVYPTDPSLPFAVSTSTGGSNYTTYAAYDGQGTDSPVVLYGSADARLVNIMPKGYDGAGSFGMYEVELYFEDDGSAPTEDPATLPNASLGKPGVVYTTQNRTDTENYTVKSVPGLTDGKLTDNWVYGSFGEMYAQIDLEIEYNVSAVNVQTYYNSSYGPLNHAWSVYLSSDGETFTKAAEVARCGHGEEGVTVSFATQSARYVRVYADFYVTSEQFSFREITVYGSVPPVPLAPVSGGVTVTLPEGGSTDALTNGVYDDDQAFTGVTGGYVTLDLGAAKAVTSVAVYTYENNSAYTVYGSADGVSYEVIGYKPLDAAANTSNGWEYILQASGTYRYIRVQWAASARSDGYLTVKEIDIFGGATEYTEVTVSNVGYVYNNSNSDDGNYGNYTFYKKANGTVLVDLGEVKDVRKVEFYASAFTPFAVERSADGENFVSFGQVLSMENGKATLTVDYSSTRYLRITGLLGASLDLAEIVVFVPSDGIPGDLDNDGNCTISDVSALLDYLSDDSRVPAAGADAADIDGSGEVTVADVTALLDMIAGMR